MSYCMQTPASQLDRKFHEIRRVLPLTQRPSLGWIRAIRNALGMTTAQLARRMGVKQPRIVELERAEKDGKITLLSLERAAEAMGCRVVYVLVPERPLTDVLQDRAKAAADMRLAAVDQTMRLESQAVTGRHAESRATLIEQLLRKPSRLWDDV
jgi:predicted DNA-binding mobile mystery protein A